ncbi:MAG: hypothetical protein ACHRHE_16460 [Tepidisphaerales bacterium]
MIRRIRTIAGTVLSHTLLRPAGWLSAAVLFVLVFAVFHALGWRDDTSFITGTVSSKGADAMVIRGMLYSVAYVAAVVVSPILVLGAGLRVLLERLLSIITESV